ncbi:MAG: hypothetical protein A2293_05050 [Elusimicrobia bacterium RIFOXYB2_FULL_49_7]|nr:MAG: hypothetical protein A2293_05050 [Elusimicrobia bacterium RIFOXYB2_FULL_49_7]
MTTRRPTIHYYDTCTLTNGLAYDRVNGRLYLMQSRGDGVKPLIHVLQINVLSDETAPAPPGGLAVQ